ncbi:MAG: PEP-utilizing enzyme [Patescibacteria group bacterium]
MLNIDPHQELFRWGPIDAKPIYVDYFNVAFRLYVKEFGRKYAWPDSIGYVRDEKVTFIVERRRLYDRGEMIFKTYILDDEKFRHYYVEWSRQVRRLLHCQGQLDRMNFRLMSNYEFGEVFQRWSDLYLQFWTIGLLPEIANWGGEQLLRRHLEAKISPESLSLVFERLSAPEDLSFYQRAELDLLKLRLLRNTHALSAKTQRLAEYQSRYFHILNSYHHTKVLGINYFKKELAHYTRERARRKICTLRSLHATVKSEKRRLIARYGLSRQVVKIASRLSFCIWWQDLRKFYIFRANHYLDTFLRECTRRYEVGLDQIYYYNYSTLLCLALTGRKFTTTELKRRKAHFIMGYCEDTNAVEYFSGAKAKHTIQSFLVRRKVRHEGDLRGLVVSHGKNNLLIAKVKVLTSPHEAYKLKRGEILVAAMTSPDYITAMRKAGAIVTDEGGMTCHAAIISRELGIPCIVNTKIATTVLHDGDVVEVDSTRGVVRKVSPGSRTPASVSRSLLRSHAT